MAHALGTGTRLPDPPLAEQVAIMREHYAAMLAHYGTEAGLRIARKHLGWYSRGLPGSAEFRAEMNRLESVPAVLALIERFYAPLIARGVARGPVLREAALAEAA